VAGLGAIMAIGEKFRAIFSVTTFPPIFFLDFKSCGCFVAIEQQVYRYISLVASEMLQK
jgi:hypothetical protein